MRKILEVLCYVNIVPILQVVSSNIIRTDLFPLIVAPRKQKPQTPQMESYSNILNFCNNVQKN